MLSISIYIMCVNYFLNTHRFRIKKRERGLFIFKLLKQYFIVNFPKMLVLYEI